AAARAFWTSSPMCGLHVQRAAPAFSPETPTMTWTMQDFDDEAQAMPALMSLKALLPEGLESVAPQIRRPLEREDYSAALAAANKAYSERGPEDRIATLTYIVLLV